MVDLKELNERIKKFENLDIKFFKYSGTGNHLTIIDEFEGEKIPEKDKPEFAKLFCRPDYGIGSDGIMFLQQSDIADARMRFFNIDGGESEMCGNGMRCIADHLLNYHLDKKECSIEVKAFAEKWKPSESKFKGSIIRIKSCEEESDIYGNRYYKVDMGKMSTNVDRMPSVHNEANKGTENEKELIEFDYKIDIENPDLSVDKDITPSSFPITLIDSGEPHVVIFAEEVGLGSFIKKFRDKTMKLKGIEMDSGTLNRLLNSIKHDSRYFSQRFPDYQVNANVVEIIDDENIRIMTSERGGAGITEACGTGATACVATAKMLGKIKSNKVLVENTGGNVIVEEKDGRYFLMGASRLIYEGRIRNK